MASTPTAEEEGDGDDCSRQDNFSCASGDVESLLAELIRKQRENKKGSEDFLSMGDRSSSEFIDSLIAALSEEYCEDDRDDDILGVGHDSIEITRRRSVHTMMSKDER